MEVNLNIQKISKHRSDFSDLNKHEAGNRGTIRREDALDIFDDFNSAVELGEPDAYGKYRKRLCELASVNDVSDTNVGNIGSEHVILNTLGFEEELRCIMCTNRNKSVSGCDGACQVNEHLFKAIIDMIDNRIEVLNQAQNSK